MCMSIYICTLLYIMWMYITQIHTIICLHAGRGIEFISLNVFPGLGLQGIASISNSSIHVSTLRRASTLYCSVAQSCPTLCLDCSTPGFPVLHHLLELAQSHVHWDGDAIQPSRPLASPSPPVFNLSQNQGLFQWVDSSNQVAKVLELQLQPQLISYTYWNCL